MYRLIILSILITMIFVGLFGCNNKTTPVDCLCTAEFRTAVVFIRDSHGTAVDSLLTTSTNKRTGRIYLPPEHWREGIPDGQGKYPVLDDGFAGYLNVAGDTIVFEAQKPGITVRQEFVFGADECKCHIQKLSGPDTLTVNSL